MYIFEETDQTLVFFFHLGINVLVRLEHSTIWDTDLFPHLGQPSGTRYFPAFGGKATSPNSNHFPF